MKNRHVFLAVAMCLLSYSTLQAQSWWKSGIRGQGDIIQKELDVSDFDGFTLAINADVKVRSGASHEMVVKAQANIIDNIELKMNDGHLRITYDRPISRSKGITIYLTVPALDKVTVSGSGKIKGEGTFKNLDDLALAVSGSGDIDLVLQAREVKTSISGSGTLRLAGTANRLAANVSGSGNVRAAELRVADAKISVSGSGNVYVHATESLEAKVSGSGNVKYEGCPRVTARASGSGNIKAIQ